MGKSNKQSSGRQKSNKQGPGRQSLLHCKKKEDTPLELGYHIFTPWRRSGYAKEACREILNYGTGRLTGCICAVIAEGNTASIRLAESLGFRLTAQRYSESAGLLYLYEASCS